MQSTDEWLPEWLRPWKPFFISLLVTPFAFLVGFADFGPEGPSIFVGYFIFPYSAFVFFVGAWVNNVSLFYLAIFLALLQFPVYGIVLSLAKNRRHATITLATIHICVTLLTFMLLFSLLIFFRPNSQITGDRPQHCQSCYPHIVYSTKKA